MSSVTETVVADMLAHDGSNGDEFDAVDTGLAMADDHDTGGKYMTAQERHDAGLHVQSDDTGIDNNDEAAQWLRQHGFTEVGVRLTGSNWHD
jgi:hypothetical protein